jgi:5-methylcytosine-specific restriction protein B
VVISRGSPAADLAFRRRFAFIDLEPSLGEPWRTYVVDKRQMEPDTAREIGQRLEGRSSRDWFDAPEQAAREVERLLEGW